MSEPRFRLRVTYRKAGMLRFLSHLETVRACERSVRRAGLPYAVTQGFNPHMRIAFGPALPVGTAGLAEMYDLWVTQHVPASEALARLASVTREEIRPHAARYVPLHAPSLAAAADVAHYEVVVSGDAEVSEALRQALDSIVASGALTVEHKGTQKVFEIAAALLKEPVVRSSDGGAVVEVTTRMSEKGSLRPDALVRAALSLAGEDAAIASVTRIGMAASTHDGSVSSL